MARGFWSLSCTLDVADLVPGVAVFDEQARLLALGGWGQARVVRAADGSVVWEGALLSAGAAPEDAGVVRVAALSGSGTWAVFATDFHTGATGSCGLFLVDLAKNRVVELETARNESCAAAVFTPDERRAVVATSTRLLTFDPRTGSATPISIPWSDGAWTRAGDTGLVCLSDTTALLAGSRHLFEIDLAHARAALRVAPSGRARAPRPGAPATRTSDGAALFAEPPRDGREHSRLWRYEGGALQKVTSVKGDIVRISPDGLTLDVLADGALRRVDVTRRMSKALRWPEELDLDPDDPIGVLAMSRDGSRAAFHVDHDLIEEVFLIADRLASPRGK